VIPDHWDVSSLGAEVEILDGRRVPVNAKERATRPGKVPYFGATGQVGWIDKPLFSEELVLLGEDGAPFFDRERNVAYRIEGPAWVNNHAHVLRAGARLTNRFLMHQLNQVDYRPYVSGTTRAKLPQGPMREIPLVVPPLGEQERIVEAIETHFSRLDAAVASLNRAKANVKRARASVLQAAVEGRLVPTEAALAHAEGRDYEPASALLARILEERKAAWVARGGKGSYVEPPDAVQSELPTLPDGWRWATCDQLTEGGFTNGLYVPKASYGRGTPILRIDDFQDDWSRSASELRRVEIDDLTAARYALEAGQLVVNRVNSMTHLGKCLGIEDRHVPAVFESNMMRATIHRGCVIQYLTSWLRSRPGKRLMLRDAKWAVNQASINQTDVGRTPVPLPPLAEQHRIVAEVDRRLSVLDALDATLDATLARCARLRQSILQRAFSGRLVSAPALTAAGGADHPTRAAGEAAK
jgi:type I restriction enzyme S subunit